MKKRKSRIYKIIIIIICIILILSLIFNIILLMKKPKEVIKIKTETKTEYIVDENIVFFGDSITYRYDIDKYFPNHHVVNKGINGNTTENLLERLDNDVIKYNPSKVFLLIGVNDLNEYKTKEEIIDNIKKIIKEINEKRKYTKIYIESILPINWDILNKNSYPLNEVLTNDLIKETNELIKEFCAKEKYTYINIYDELKDDNGNLKEEYTIEGQHLNDAGYEKITSILNKYIEKN